MCPTGNIDFIGPPALGSSKYSGGRIGAPFRSEPNMRQSKFFALILVVGAGESLLASNPGLGSAETVVPGYRLARAEAPRIAAPSIRGRSVAPVSRVAIPSEILPLRFDVENLQNATKFPNKVEPVRVDVLRLDYRTPQPTIAKPVGPVVAPPTYPPATAVTVKKPLPEREQGPQAITVWQSWGEWRPK